MSESFSVMSSGAEIRATRWGTGPQLVVLLHAGVCDRRSWSGVAPQLSEAVTVVAYDRRGHGESQAAPTASLEAADLLAVLDHLNVDAAWLVGSSRGGAVALQTALLAPTRVQGLVLQAPAVPGGPEPEIDADTARLVELLMAATASGDFAEANRLHAWLWLDGPGQVEGRVAGEPRDLLLEMNAVVLANGTREDDTQDSVDVWGRLNEISVPVTVACGDFDVPFIVRACPELAHMVQRGEHRTLPGMAHLPYLEDPVTFAALINEALRA